jgi:predicted HTH domain antitoxin
MMQMLLDIPDRYLLGITAEELAEQFKLYTALLMFQAGRLSAGAACEFAGVDRYTFIAACKRHRIDVIDYDDEELAADLEHLKNNCSHAHHR